MFVKALLPISFGDLGVREATSIYFLSKYGIADVVAFNSSLLLFTINMIIPALVGLLFFPSLYKKNDNLQKRSDK